MRFFGLTAAVLALSASAAQAQTIHRLDGSKISIGEANAFAAKTFEAAHVTGAEIAVINRGQMVWTATFGVRRKEPLLPMDRDTTTWAASITKSVFATYVMTLVERGEFNLDQPVVNQLKNLLNEYEPYKETASDLVHDPAWPSVTPRMLLSHSSGLANFAFLEPDKKMHLHFKPGTHFQYSGEGFNLVQFVIEQKMHKRLDELMQDALFKPLGMTHTGLIYRNEFAADVADRYDRSGNFRSQTKRFPGRAAGSMSTSAVDLAKFTTAFLDGKIVGSGTRAEMLKPVLKIDTIAQFGPGASQGKGKEAEGVGLAYGVGWGLLTHTRFGPAFFKEGHGDGAENYMICFERQRSCMILLTNSDNGELAFRPLLETILGDTVTPWEWEGYTPALIEEYWKANP